LKLQANPIGKTEENVTVNCQGILDIIKKPSVILIGLGIFMRWGCGFGRGFFDPPYYMMAFPENKETITWVLCFSLLSCSLSSYTLGKFSDCFYLRFPKIRPVLVSASLLVSLPFVYIGYNSLDFDEALVFLALSYFVAEAYSGCVLGTIIDNSDVGTRGLETGIIFTLGYVGGMTYSMVLGFFASSVGNLRQALTYSGVGSIFLTSVCFALLVCTKKPARLVD